jgi:hypothetical protein
VRSSRLARRQHGTARKKRETALLRLVLFMFAPFRLKKMYFVNKKKSKSKKRKKRKKKEKTK